MENACSKRHLTSKISIPDEVADENSPACFQPPKCIFNYPSSADQGIVECFLLIRLLGSWHCIAFHQSCWKGESCITNQEQWDFGVLHLHTHTSQPVTRIDVFLQLAGMVGRSITNCPWNTSLHISYKATAGDTCKYQQCWVLLVAIVRISKFNRLVNMHKSAVNGTTAPGQTRQQLKTTPGFYQRRDLCREHNFFRC